MRGAELKSGFPQPWCRFSPSLTCAADGALVQLRQQWRGAFLLLYLLLLVWQRHFAYFIASRGAARMCARQPERKLGKARSVSGCKRRVGIIMFTTLSRSAQRDAAHLIKRVTESSPARLRRPITSLDHSEHRAHWRSVNHASSARGSEGFRAILPGRRMLIALTRCYSPPRAVGMAAWHVMSSRSSKCRSAGFRWKGNS